MRSLYASQFIVPTEMSLRSFTEEQVQRIHPDVSPSVQLGVDLRTMWAYADDDERPERNFFQMQGDVYTTFTVDDRFSANLGVSANSAQGQEASVEVYALAWVLPWSGYVKAGRFTPVFGWRFEDHNRFTRTELWFDEPYNTDAGIEIGIYPKHVAVWASVMNGEPGTNTLWDSNREPAFAGGALLQFRVSEVGIGIGGSGWRNVKEPVGVDNGRRTAAGPFGYLAWGPLSYLWEVDASRLTIPNESSVTLLVTSHELGWQMRPGVDVVGTYDYVDPNIDLKSGARFRYGLGVECMPVPFVQLQAAVNYHDNKPGTNVAEEDFTRAEVQLHLFY
jgi:hypothetical protein